MTVMQEADHLTPAEMAQRTGLSLDTLRYYEREGLLGPVDRLPNGHRRYSAADLGFVEVLRCLRDTAMPIRDIREFAQLVREDDRSTDTARLALLDAHRTAVLASIEEMYAALEVIERKRDFYARRLAGTE
jgi:DNA-binding transcriptional MerR regulator